MSYLPGIGRFLGDDLEGGDMTLYRFASGPAIPASQSSQPTSASQGALANDPLVAEALGSDISNFSHDSIRNNSLADICSNFQIGGSGWGPLPDQMVLSDSGFGNSVTDTLTNSDFGLDAYDLARAAGPDSIGSLPGVFKDPTKVAEAQQEFLPLSVNSDYIKSHPDADPLSPEERAMKKTLSVAFLADNDGVLSANSWLRRITGQCSANRSSTMLSL